MKSFAAIAFFAIALVTSCGNGTSSNTNVGPPDAGPPANDDGGVVPVPTNVDCSDPANCYHLACYAAPSCTGTPDPGGCPVGEVRDPKYHVCRPCQAADCDGLPSFCCGADVCQNSVECQLYICASLPSSCNGTTSGSCGYRDADDDDAWGDCDEAPKDPCCYCKVAVGCADSKCGIGNYVKKGACTSCTASDCAALSCMGANGCPTNCPGGQFFDGVSCRDCASTSQASVIPACVFGPPADAGTSDTGAAPDASSD